MRPALNLTSLLKTEDQARALLEEIRWGKDCVDAACPHCGAMNPYRLTPKPGSKTRPGLWKCRDGQCRKQFTVTVGTVFEASHVPLVKWWSAIQLLASATNGISAHQIHRHLRVSYQTAWFMAHRLRYAMMHGPMLELMSGLPINETNGGGRTRRGSTHSRPRQKGRAVMAKRRRRRAYSDTTVPAVPAAPRDIMAALLRTPPPRPGDPGTRKQLPTTEALHARLRANTAKLRKEHQKLEAKPFSAPEHRAHLARLREHRRALKAHVAALRKERQKRKNRR